MSAVKDAIIGLYYIRNIKDSDVVMCVLGCENLNTKLISLGITDIFKPHDKGIDE